VEARCTQEYARLRIGVGAPPPGADLAGLGAVAHFDEDEERGRRCCPDARGCGHAPGSMTAWSAANRFNR
jgi:hypothetical protein